MDTKTVRKPTADEWVKWAVSKPTADEWVKWAVSKLGTAVNSDSANSDNPYIYNPKKVQHAGGQPAFVSPCLSAIEANLIDQPRN